MNVLNAVVPERVFVAVFKKILRPSSTLRMPGNIHGGHKLEVKIWTYTLRGVCTCTHWPIAVSRCMVEGLLFYALLLILYSQGSIAWSLENVCLPYSWILSPDPKAMITDLNINKHKNNTTLTTLGWHLLQRLSIHSKDRKICWV